MYPKSKNRKRARRDKCVEVKAEAVRILRTLNEQEAFHFYEDIGKPTGQHAASLNDFLDKMKTTKLESILFHLQRKDFENWANKTLGDPKLAKKIAKVPISTDEDVRAQICTIVENRVKELSQAPLTAMIIEDLTLTPEASSKI
jgi:hypothetical protein